MYTMLRATLAGVLMAVAMGCDLRTHFTAPKAGFGAPCISNADCLSNNCELHVGDHGGTCS